LSTAAGEPLTGERGAGARGARIPLLLALLAFTVCLQGARGSTAGTQWRPRPKPCNSAKAPVGARPAAFVAAELQAFVAAEVVLSEAAGSAAMAVADSVVPPLASASRVPSSAGRFSAPHSLTAISPTAIKLTAMTPPMMRASSSLPRPVATESPIACSVSGPTTRARALFSAVMACAIPARERVMTRDVTARPRAILPANKLSALVLGAAAIGALAIGALAIGHVAVGRLVIRKARIGALEVDDLTVRRLRVVEHEGPSS